MPERLRWSLLSTLWKYHNFKVTIYVCCRIGMLCTDPWGCPWESKFLMPLWWLSLPIRQRRTWLLKLKYFQHCFHILPLSQNRIHSHFLRSQLFLTSTNYNTGIFTCMWPQESTNWLLNVASIFYKPSQSWESLTCTHPITTHILGQRKYMLIGARRNAGELTYIRMVKIFV